MKQKTGRKLLGVLLALVIGLVPGMSLTAYADGSVKEVSTADGFKQYTIKATVKGLKSGLAVLDYGGLLRYYSSNSNVAKVNASGVITAVNPGTCTVYAVTSNGIRTKVKVTVAR